MQKHIEVQLKKCAVKKFNMINNHTKENINVEVKETEEVSTDLM